MNGFDVEIDVPPELEAGVYANFAAVWYSPYEFTLDFAVFTPHGGDEHESSETSSTRRVRLLSRVKLPPAIVFDVLRAVSDSMSAYEERFGEIRRPERGDGEEAQ